MSIAFLIIFVLAVLHFIYEGIVLPSVRLELRCQLYALRDKLRRLRVEDNTLSPEVFNNLQDSIHGLLDILPFITITFIRRLVREAYKNRGLHERINKRLELYKHANSNEVNDILRGLDKIWIYTVVLNSMAAVLYLLPVFLSFELFSFLKKIILNQNVTNLKKLIHKASLTPANELNSYALPQDSAACFA